MGDLSQHFSRHEFTCKGHHCCGGVAPVDGRLIAALETFRTLVDGPVHITSGFRCLTYNRTLNSLDTSQHPRGYAADIARIPNMSIDEMAALAETIDAFQQGGIGRYPTFLHLDVRQDGSARWKR